MSGGHVARGLLLFAPTAPSLHQGRQNCLPEQREVSCLEEKGRNLAYSYSRNSSLWLYLAVIQLHLRQAALPYAAGLPQDTPSSAQSWHCPSFPSKGCSALGWISATCPHGYKQLRFPLRCWYLLRVACKAPSRAVARAATHTYRQNTMPGGSRHSSTYAAEEGFCDIRISQKPYNIAVSQTKVR